MKTKSILIIFAGAIVLAMSLFFAGAQAKHTATTPAPEVAQPALVQVIVAAADIAYGDEIGPDKIKVLSWPQEALPLQAFTEKSDLLADDGQAPRRAKGQIFEGEIILNTKVSGFGEALGLVHSLGPNTRAMSIKVDAVTAVSGFIAPGDHVDVVLTEGRGENMKAATILQNIRVIGVDQYSKMDHTDPTVARTVTVEVTPHDGQVLALSQNLGTLSLKLRALDAVDEDNPTPVRAGDIFANQDDPSADAPRNVVRVRRGLDSEVQEVEVPGGN